MKKILFFATMFIVALCATSLVSCGSNNDDEKPGTNSFVYTLQVTLTDDVAYLYSGITANITYPDGVTHQVKVTSPIITDRCESDVHGNVTIQIEGDLKADAIDDTKSYTVGISHLGKCNKSVDTSNFSSKKLGNVIREKYAKLSSLGGAKHTYTFVQN